MDKRLITLWSTIDDIMMDSTYYDDETQKTVCDISLNALTKAVLKTMKNTEIRFLGKEKVEAECEKFYNDDEYHHKILMEYKLY